MGVYVVQLIVNDGHFDSAPDTVTISTPRVLSITPSAVSLSPGGSQTLTVSVTYSSSTNLVLQLSSSNTNVATVPASVTILANQTSARRLVSRREHQRRRAHHGHRTGRGIGECERRAWLRGS